MPETGSPFEGLKPSTKMVAQGGKQKKAPGTGFYEDEAGKIFYVKRAEYLADNIAEVVSSDLLELAMGEQAVRYRALQNQQDKSIFIASEVSKGFSNLKTYVERKKTAEKRKPYTLPMVGANLLFKAVKKTIFKALEKEEEKKGLARVLAGSLWIGEYDCQVQNILIGKDRNGKPMVKKFDNGWGLADICKPGNEKVDLFGRRALYGKSATHKRSGIPTNHFNDYPDIINSQYFVEALRDTIAEATPEKIWETVHNSVEKIIQDYYKPDRQLEALTAFAEHMGIAITQKNNVTELKNEISFTLSTRLCARAESLELLAKKLEKKLAPSTPSASILKRIKSSLTPKQPSFQSQSLKATASNEPITLIFKALRTKKAKPKEPTESSPLPPRKI